MTAKTFDTAPAMDWTCRGGTGEGFCQFCSWPRSTTNPWSLSASANCDIFGALKVVDGWVQRHANCKT